MAQTTAPQWTRWQEIIAIWRDNRWLFVIAGWLLGILTFPFIQQVARDGLELLNNLVPEAVGIVFTVLILDRLAENRAIEQLKQRLVHEAGSQSNETAKTAIDWMRNKRWLKIDDDIQLLKGAYLRRANLWGAYLNQVNLQKANLTRANLSKARLRGANLIKADLSNANMQDASIRYADLSGANLRNSMLNVNSLRKSNLQDANLSNTDLSGAKLIQVNLKKANLTGAKFDEKTLLPDAVILKDANGKTLRDELGKSSYTSDSYWTPETDMSRYTDPNHPDFWQPDWAKGQANDKH